MRAFVVSLFVAVSAAAAPVITSISPRSGTVAGGTVVTIKGSGFVSSATVSFSTENQIPAANVTFVDSSTIQATTPPLLPNRYSVSVRQSDGLALALTVFTVTGDPSEGFESILFPIFSGPIDGAFGSRFVTDAHAVATTEAPVTIDGFNVGCPGPGTMLTVPGGTDVALSTGCFDFPPARILYVAKDQARNVTFNDRVTDITRTASSLGTEIPIVRSSRMTNGKIVLPNVPIDSRYRLTLRIYALRPAVVFVTTVGQQQPVTLAPGGTFTPAYAQFTSFPIPIDNGSSGSITVTIEQPQDIIAGPPMWAFITVTNNQTQQITTITPEM